MSSLKFSLAGFEIDLGEFAQVVRDLATAQLDSQTKEALRTLIAEARKSFDVVIDVVTPLYAVNSEAAMRAAFPQLYANFKNAYLKHGDEIRTHCHIVRDQINTLKDNKAWRQNIPVLQNAFQRLAQSSKKWVGNDDALADKMDDFLNEMNTELSGINKTLQGDAAAAYRDAAALVAETDDKIKKIRSQLNILREVSNRLTP
jgi:F0F1-type ATP synthase delta subunit